MPLKATLLSDADALRQRNRELGILNAIAEALNRTVDLNQALETTLTQVAELFTLQTCWIWLLHPLTGETYLAAARRLPPALVNNPERMEGSCYCLDTFEEDDLEGAANINAITCSRLKKLAAGTEGLRYHASIPLRTHERKLGVLNVASADWTELSPDDLRLLHTVGDLLSIAIERAQLFARSAQLGAAEERNRIAREMHDTLAQGLTAIALQLDSADVLLEAGVPVERVQAPLRRALALTHANLEETRRSVLDLRAAPLEGRTLAEALQVLVEDAAAQGYNVVWRATGAHRPLSPCIEVGVYRVAQEALANAKEHSRAQQIIVRFETTAQLLRLSVEDDGQGFDVERVVQGHFGLIGMTERAKLLNGSLLVQTNQGMGTRIELTVPLEEM